MAIMYKSVKGASAVQPTGNAQPADVLSGKTFSNASGIDKTGTMVNRGAVSETIAGGQTYTIPVGYHNGSGTVTAQQSGGTFNTFDGTGNVTAGHYYSVMGWDSTKNDLANGTWSGAEVMQANPTSGEHGSSSTGYYKIWILKATSNVKPTFSINGPAFYWCGEFSNIV